MNLDQEKQKACQGSSVNIVKSWKTVGLGHGVSTAAHMVNELGRLVQNGFKNSWSTLFRKHKKISDWEKRIPPFTTLENVNWLLISILIGSV